MAFIDRCQTADDVRENARRVMERRRAQWRETKARMYAPKPPEPESFFDRLVREAYPAVYPIQPVTQHFNIRQIQEEVCRVADIKLSEMIRKSRHTKLVIARHIAVMLSRHFTSRSLPEIGRMFGGRDHTTIIHACAKLHPVLSDIEGRLSSSASLAEWVAAAFEAYDRIKPKGIGRKMRTSDIPA